MKRYLEKCQYNNNHRRGFTLLEIMVAVVVFALVMTAAGGIFISVQRSWQRQRQIIDLVQNARWAMEKIANEARLAIRSSVSVDPAGESVEFRMQRPGGPWWSIITVRYFRGNGAFGSRRTLYRQSGSVSQELANFIVDNPSGNPIFNWNTRLLTIELTLSVDDRRYTLRTQVRPRSRWLGL